MKKILVAYGTKTDTTKEVAEEIGNVLEQCGFTIELKQFHEVKTIEGYQGVVVGAPINGMSWRPDAKTFIKEHAEQLNKIPTAYFNVSYLIYIGRDMWKKAIKNSFNKASQVVKPVMTGTFGGRVEAAFPAVARFIFGVKKGASLDQRNWDIIQIWADELSREFS